MTRGARRTGAWTVVALTLAASGACGSPVPEGSGAPVGSSTPTSASTTSTVPVPPPGLGFSNDDFGRTATVDVGERVTVILHSADFVFAPPSDPSVLRDDGPPTVAPGGPPCVETAGSGCGAVVASFVAVGPGQVTITADRARCPELGCPPDVAHWELLVQVVGDVPTTTTVPTTPTAVESDVAEVRGTVLFSPVCPVEQIPPDPACAPRPGPADIELAHPDGTVAAAATAGEDGAFTVPVAPGSYIVRATSPGQTLGGGCQADPAEVVVEPGSSVTIAVTCDTGIR